MTDTLIHEIILIYSWVSAGFLMIFITAIGVFYQKKFGGRTFYYFYFIPVIAILIAAFRLFSSYNTLLSESIELIGSGGSFIASYFLYRKILGVK